MKKERNAVLRFFSRFSRFVYCIIAGSFIGKLFSSYGTFNEAVIAAPRRRRAARTARGRKRHYTVRRAIACAMEQNIFSRARRRCVAALVASSLRTVGFFFSVLGGLWIALYGASVIASLPLGATFDHLIAGGVVLFVGVLLLFSDRSVGAMLRHGSLLGALLFGVFGLRDDLARDVKPRGKHHFIVALLLTLPTAALGLLITPLSILAILGTLVCILAILSVPEVGFLLAIVFLPFSKLLVGSDAITLACLVFMAFGYFGKLLRGNRAFRLELQDLPVLLFLLLFALSAKTPATGHVLGDVLLEILIALTYLIAVNVLSTPHWLSASRVALALSAIGSSFVGIGQLIYAMINTEGATLWALPQFSHAVKAGFADENAFAYYLVIAFAFVMPSIPFTPSRRRIWPVLASIFIGSCAALTFHSAALLALLLIVVVFVLVFEYRSLPFVLLSGGAVGGTLLLLGREIRDRFFSFFVDFSNPTLVDLRRAGRDTVSRLFAGGGEGMASRASAVRRFIFGAGHRGLEALYPYFGDPTIPFSYGAYHFFGVLLSNYGLVGLLACACFLLLLFQNCFSVMAMSRDRGRSLFAYVGVVLAAAMVFLGFFSYAWYDLAALTVFFCATALVAAAMRHERHRREIFVDREDYGQPSAQIDYVARVSRASKKRGGVVNGEQS